MSFNKSKTRQSAERYLAQGKIKAAITEYVFIVDNDPTDFNTLNVLGDLYARMNEKEQAIECFKKLAEHYNKQGFSQKAIAVYNKISRLKPDSVEVSAKLAPLYQMKGLVAEARSHYSVLAEYYKNNGKKLEALKIWQQIAELDPNNVEVFFTLAENYLQENYTDEAAEAFTEAGRRFANQKNFDKAIHAYTKALAIHPLDIAAIEGLIACQMTVGSYDEAINLIESTLEQYPNNVDLLSLLLSCHVELNSYVEAENTVIAIVELEPSNYRKFLDVVGLHLKNKDTASATRMLSMCSEHLLVAGQADELKVWIDEILAQNPEEIDALTILVRLHAWQRDDTELKSALIQLAEAAHANDDPENEKSALSQLVVIAPEEIRFRERLAELGGSAGEASHPYSYNTTDSNTAVLGNDIPTFESFENLSNNDEEYQPSALAIGEEDISSLTSDSDLGLNGFAFVSDDSQYSNGNGKSNGNGNGNGHHSSTPKVELSDDDVVAESPAEQALDPRREAHLRQELESVDFYLNEGYQDLALQTLDLLESQFGMHPEIATRRKQLPDDPNRAAHGVYQDELDAEVLIENESVSVVEETETAVAEDSMSYEAFAAMTAATNEAPEVVYADADEVVEEKEQEVQEVSYESLVQEEISQELTETAENVSPEAVEEVLREMEEVALAETRTSVDFATPATEAPETLETAETIEDVEIPVKEDLQSMLEDEFDEAVNLDALGGEHSLFEDFRSDLGLEENEPVAADSDYETHFNLGTAYKEMGLYEDAVGAFQEAVKLVTADDEGRRFLSCCHSLGHCFMEKSMPKLAQLWYEKALQSRNLTAEEKQALNYEIALSFEKQGNPKQAAELYSGIYALDVTYRDVKQKLESLQSHG